jgi:hypothetical protein
MSWRDTMSPVITGSGCWRYAIVRRLVSAHSWSIDSPLVLLEPAVALNRIARRAAMARILSGSDSGEPSASLKSPGA